MTHFRKRITREMIDQVNEWMIEEQRSGDNQDDDSDASGGESDGSPDGPNYAQGKDRRKKITYLI